MEFDTSNHHIAVVAPLPSDYETARALLDDPYPEYLLTPSKAACTLGKIGPHNVVLVGKNESTSDCGIFVKNTVTDLLGQYPSIRAGFLLGVDAIAPNGGIARAGDVVVGVPHGLQPGLVQFDAEETSVSGRLLANHQLGRPPSCIMSAIYALRSSSGRQEWEQHIESQLQKIPFCAGSDTSLGVSTRVIHGKIASSAQPLPGEDVINKVGKDSNVACFEQAAANLEHQLPFLTVCGVSSQKGTSTDRLTQMAAVISVVFLVSKIDTNKLGTGHAFVDLFRYGAFDLDRPGFRLVRLEGGSQFPIKCHIFQAYLDDEESIPYEALSYVWGDQNTPDEIRVNNKVMLVTSSLQDALCHLRHSEQDRILWIDALCIDQRNIRERGHQVSHMGEIYKKAESVVIWFGYLDEDASLLQSVVDEFKQRLPPESFKKWPRKDGRWRDQWDQVVDNIRLSSREKLASGLRNFASHPWFTRVWILQEVANARRAIIKWSSGEIPTRVFTLLPHALGTQVSDQCQAVLDIMPGPFKNSTWWNQNRNLCNLLWKFRGCQATDPRDKVYALLEMASDMEYYAIRADYSKEEHNLLADLCEFFFEETWLFDNPLAASIREFQAELPSLSRRFLLQKIKHKTAPDSFLRFLDRQGSMPMIDRFSVYDMTPAAFGTSLDLFEISTKRQLLSPEAVRDVMLWMAQTKHPTLQPLVERLNSEIIATPKFIVQAMEYHPHILQQLARLPGRPIDFQERVFHQAIVTSEQAVLRFLDHCSQSFKVTETSLIKAMRHNITMLEYLLANTEGKFELEKFELEGGLLLPVIFRNLRAHRSPISACNHPINITRIVVGAATRYQFPLEEYILSGWASSMEVTESVTIEAIQTGELALRFIINIAKAKVQITDRVLDEAKNFVDCHEILKAIKRSETDVSEDEAIEAIQSGPRALRELLDRRDMNFKVTDQILTAARRKEYAFEILKSRRQSEVCPDESGIMVNHSRGANQVVEHEAKRINIVRSYDHLRTPNDGVQLLSFLWSVPTSILMALGKVAWD